MYKCKKQNFMIIIYIGRKMSQQLGFIDGTESSGGGSSGEDRDRGCWVVRLVRAEQ